MPLRQSGGNGIARVLRSFEIGSFGRERLWLDAAQIADFYAEDAINHQVANEPVIGKTAIAKMFAPEFRQAEMVCIVENVFKDGDWAILEWKDPLGLRSCGFFHVKAGKILLQRGYWDKLSFLRQHGLPLPVE